MKIRSIGFSLAASLIFSGTTGWACCPVAPSGSHVINTDQSVIILWDKKKETQHFIRRANFKTDAKDIGFIVPSPSRPQLEESGDRAFDGLAEITAPKRPPAAGLSFGCAPAPQALRNEDVVVIDQKRVAGYDATVLTARSGDDLVKWLDENGYPHSPAVAKWAKPYLGGDWHFTALKLVKDGEQTQSMGAAALRISFQTGKPLFPYREPDSAESGKALTPQARLLRIYLVAETQYEGKIGGESWTGITRWSGDITKHRNELMKALGLAEDTGPDTLWLTEIEDRWPYQQAAGDVWFSPVGQVREIDRDGRNQLYQLDTLLILFLGLGLFRVLRKTEIAA